MSDTDDPPLVCHGTTYFPHDRVEMYERGTGGDGFYRCPTCRRVVKRSERGDA